MFLWALLALCIGDRVSALIQPIGLPKVLEECYDEQTRFVNITEVPSQNIVAICVYGLEIENIRDEFEMTEDAKRYLNSLMRKVVGNEMKKRKKRQVDLRDTYAERQEIRMYSDSEWRRLVGRLNELKRSTDVRPNRYDAIARYHQGSTIARAHRGPAFLPWHRIYLLAIEAALEMTIPYWNSSIDFYMGDPSDSVIFTPERLGNGEGAVVTGPFANWGIRRDIAGDGSLISQEMVDSVLSRRFQSQISEGTRDTNSRYSLEAVHNAVHNWVGGGMSTSSTAAFDPIFFMHHAFIDYIWHLFNIQQRENGIDTFRDYPLTNRRGHRARDRMPIFTNLRNEDGNRDYYAQLTDYLDFPPCPACGMLFGMQCINGQCVAVEPFANFGFRRTTGMADALSGFSGFPSSASTRLIPIGTVEQFNPPEQSVAFSARGDAGAAGTESSFENFINHFIDLRTRQGAAVRGKRFANDNKISLSAFERKELTSEERNDFVIDGISDHNQWFYINVAVNYNRFRDNKSNKIQPAKLERCARTPPGGAKVWVQSDGINYSGRYKDFVTFQNDSQSLIKKVMIGFKKPGNTSTEVYVTAHDTCGRACSLDCSAFKHTQCTGAYKITQDFPLMFSTDNVSYDLESPIVFNCNFDLEWPWL